MKASVFCVLLACFLAAAVARRESIYRAGWELVDEPVNKEVTLRVTFALKQQNLDKLNELVWLVSDPKSDNYGQYLSVSELSELISPSEEDFSTLINFIHKNNGFNIDTVQTKDVVKATFFAQDLERAFSLNFELFKHSVSGHKLLRSIVPPVFPTEIENIVDILHGVSDFPSPSNYRVSKDRNLETMKKAVSRAIEEDNSAPTIVVVSSRSFGSVSVVFAPVCQSGSPKNSSKPCKSPEIESASMALSSNATLSSPVEYNATASSVECDNGVCIATFSVSGYLPWNIDAFWEVFSDGSMSDSTAHPYPFISLPSVIPQTINDLYGIPEHEIVTNAEATQCVVEFEQQYYTRDDLKLFYEEMGFDTNYTVVEIGPNPQDAGVEANLDIQYIMGMAVGSPTFFWSINASSTEEIDDILQWAYAIGNYSQPPLVNSLSYGMAEANVDEYLGDGYLARSDVEFQKLAALGLTVIIASGDTGAGDLGGPPMGMSNCSKLHPDWPSQSPYVTAVGSTYISQYAQPGCYEDIDCSANPMGEVGVSVANGLFWTTGGGFSEVQPVASFQEKFVSRYLETDDVPPSKYFNKKGRGYPDVASVGHNLMVMNDGTMMAVDGTSASAPIFAGIVTLLNNERMNQNMAPMGWLNPFLYSVAESTPTAFYDVTVGQNNCGAYGSAPVCCPYGFKAAPGWDPVAGLGTPRYPALLEAALAF